MFSLPDHRSFFDVYDTTLPTNSLLAKSIQILTVASRFLTARPALDTYLSNMSIRRAGSICVSEADKLFMLSIPWWLLLCTYSSSCIQLCRDIREPRGEASLCSPLLLLLE